MIRKYQTDDLMPVLRVWESASAVGHPFFSDAFLASERQNIIDLHLPTAETWVWEEAGRVAGFISLVGDEIGGLFVDPALHGCGIGRALVDHARGMRDTLEVEVLRANVVGRKFYDAYGFIAYEEGTHQTTGLEVLRLRLPSNS